VAQSSDDDFDPTDFDENVICEEDEGTSAKAARGQTVEQGFPNAQPLNHPSYHTTQKPANTQSQPLSAKNTVAKYNNAASMLFQHLDQQDRYRGQRPQPYYKKKFTQSFRLQNQLQPAQLHG